MDLLGGLKNHFIPSPNNDFRPHLLRRAWLVFFLAVILTAEGFLVTQLLLHSDDQTAAVIQSELVSLTNDERVYQNKTLLQENTLLNAAAEAKAQDMAAKGYSHDGPDGKLPWEWIQEAGYQYTRAGENLAVRFVDSRDVVEAWMASPAHRDNLLKGNYSEIGIGVADGVFEGSPATYIVQFFGSPATASANENKTIVSAENQSEPSAIQTPAVPAVAAAETATPSVSQAQTFTKTLERFFERIFEDPRVATNWLLGGTATLMALAVIFAFFVYIQIQHNRMLMGGVAMTLFALALFFINENYFDSLDISQSASVANSFAKEIPIDSAHWISLEQ